MGDGKFFDLAGINHGLRGANLSETAMFATPGYVSTLDPTTATPDSSLRIPAINFDYSSGEKLIVWMLGKWTPEASAQAAIGDGYGTSAGQRGWAIRVSPTGKVQPILYGASIGYGGASGATAFDGTLHDFAVVLDGQNRQYCTWVDGAIDSSFGARYVTFSADADYDTKTTNTVNLGSSAPAPGGTLGMASAVRACVILRLPATYPTPTPSSFTAVFSQLRANPGKLILGSAF
jgi:hypothetical protein